VATVAAVRGGGRIGALSARLAAAVARLGALGSGVVVTVPTVETVAVAFAPMAGVDLVWSPTGAVAVAWDQAVAVAVFDLTAGVAVFSVTDAVVVVSERSGATVAFVAPTAVRVTLVWTGVASSRLVEV
jgi:hypothetical protein